MSSVLPSWSAPLAASEPRQQLGHAGEIAAGRLLEQHGFSVLAHRFRAGRHEMDLIARRGSLVCFIEVKTRSGVRCGRADEALGMRQRRVMLHLAGLWVARHGRAGEEYRFDLVAVAPAPDGWAVRWIRDAFRA